MGAKVVIANMSDERSEALAREVGAGSLYVPTNYIDFVDAQRRRNLHVQQILSLQPQLRPVLGSFP